MGDLAQLNLRSKSWELRPRALLEDWIEYHRTSSISVQSGRPLALAVWFEKSPGSDEQNLLELYAGPPIRQRVMESRFPLELDPTSQGPPFINISATTVEYFTQQLEADRPSLEKYPDRCEVLFFDKSKLNDAILAAFRIVTEPSGLLKGWYAGPSQLAEIKEGRLTVPTLQQSKPSIGLVKTYESPDFEHCRGLVHVEVNQTWIPLSSEALPNYNFYADVQGQQPGQFIFQGGSHYRILRFEVKTCPDYSALVLEKLRHDRYPEVYLRAVHPPERSASGLHS